MTLNRYWSSNCKTCPLKDRCTPSQQRRVTRWEHHDVLDDMQEQLERSPDAMRIRRCLVEHPFGTIKSWMGATHFMTKGLERVKTEMSLHVLAYNVKRLMSLHGVAGMMEAIRAYAFLLDLQRVFGAGAVLIRSASPKTGTAP
jgi:transposase